MNWLPFTESLYLELKDKGVKVQVLCPSFIDTDFYRYTTVEKKEKFARSKEKLSPEKIVEYSLKSLNKNQAICIPGRRARIACWIVSLLPRNMVYSLVERQFKVFR